MMMSHEDMNSPCLSHWVLVRVPVMPPVKPRPPVSLRWLSVETVNYIYWKTFYPLKYWSIWRKYREKLSSCCCLITVALFLHLHIKLGTVSESTTSSQYSLLLNKILEKVGTHKLQQTWEEQNEDIGRPKNLKTNLPKTYKCQRAFMYTI